MSGRRAVFLDRDGVLVVPSFRNGRSFAPTTLEQFEIYPEAPECLSRLKQAGFLLVVVTNQPDVGAGRVRREIIEEMHMRLRQALPLDAIKVCFHRQNENCTCRKPLPGLLLEAADELVVDLANSVMIGDRASDVEAGFAAGCSTVFIDLNYTAETPPKRVDFTAAGLTEAVNWLLRHRGRPTNDRKT